MGLVHASIDRSCPETRNSTRGTFTPASDDLAPHPPAPTRLLVLKSELLLNPWKLKLSFFNFWARWNGMEWNNRSTGTCSARRST